MCKFCATRRLLTDAHEWRAIRRNGSTILSVEKRIWGAVAISNKRRHRNEVTREVVRGYIMAPVAAPMMGHR
jgi:hypothetical protein